MDFIGCKYIVNRYPFISKCRTKRKGSSFAETLLFPNVNDFLTQEKFSNLVQIQFRFPFLCDIFYSATANPAILCHPVYELIHDRISVFRVGHVYYHVYFNFFHRAKVQTRSILRPALR